MFIILPGLSNFRRFFIINLLKISFPAKAVKIGIYKKQQK